MLIGELAQKTGVSIYTIRFYEKQGVVGEQHYNRLSNGYRDYNEAAVQRLRLIQQAQAAGITLSEMRESMDEWEAGDIRSEEKIEFFQNKLKQIDQRIAALQGIKAYLQQKLAATETESETMVQQKA
jgi:MerR family transcriptional regulator, copper efflux regulator